MHLKSGSWFNWIAGTNFWSFCPQFPQKLVRWTPHWFCEHLRNFYFYPFFRRKHICLHAKSKQKLRKRTIHYYTSKFICRLRREQLSVHFLLHRLLLFIFQPKMDRTNLSKKDIKTAIPSATFFLLVFLHRINIFHNWENFSLFSIQQVNSQCDYFMSKVNWHFWNSNQNWVKTRNVPRALFIYTRYRQLDPFSTSSTTSSD